MYCQPRFVVPVRAGLGACSASACNAFAQQYRGNCDPEVNHDVDGTLSQYAFYTAGMNNAITCKTAPESSSQFCFVPHGTSGKNPGEFYAFKPGTGHIELVTSKTPDSYYVNNFYASPCAPGVNPSNSSNANEPQNCLNPDYCQSQVGTSSDRRADAGAFLLPFGDELY